tara:strand:+ start:9029 stop:10048 length:1020 start_codon:yes stop_codon:yes gene_type:complete
MTQHLNALKTEQLWDETQLSIGSFCSGYGGLDLAVEDFFDGELKWWCDTDKTSQHLMNIHWPKTTFHKDVTTINPHDLEPVDIINAGFPCQPFSHAGQMKGNNDERAIFSWIADCISVVRPRYVFLENVSAITFFGGGVIGELTKLGYDSKWGIVRASDVGATHQRARWFCFSFLADKQTHKRRFISDSERQPFQRRRKFGLLESSKHNEQELVRDSFASSSKTASNSYSSGSKTRFDSRSDSGRLRSQSLGSSTSCNVDWGEYREAIDRWTRIIGRVAPAPVENGKLSQHFVEWMMGLEEGFVCDHIPQRTKALSCLGNGVVPQQALLALQLLTSGNL